MKIEIDREALKASVQKIRAKVTELEIVMNNLDLSASDLEDEVTAAVTITDPVAILEKRLNYIKMGGQDGKPYPYGNDAFDNGYEEGLRDAIRALKEAK